MNARAEELRRLARTVGHLRPEQVAHRVRLRGQKAALKQTPEQFERRWQRPVPEDAGWPALFMPIDRQVPPHGLHPHDLRAGRFSLIGEHHVVVAPEDWMPSERTQLFRYTLHYFEWAWALLNDPEGTDTFDALWASWRQGTTFGQWDEWSPYVVALRAWALCGLFDPLVRGGQQEADVREQLGLHAGFIDANLELDVGGNHLMKNLKALIGVGVFLHDDELVERGTSLLVPELERQILPDGGHYERSPSYHCQVLADLIDIESLLAAADRPPVAGLTDARQRMQRWLGAMLLPDGDVPLFGDATLVGLERIAALAPDRSPRTRLTHLEDSGYVVCRPSDRLHVIVDVGPPCPPDLPAHAQAGCLSFVASVDGRRTIVDTGTSTYVGKRRAYERSTAAHNTVEVAEQNQTEVWSSFRAGRLANPSVHTVSDVDGTIVVEASHDGYEHLDGSPMHRRRFTIGRTTMEIHDTVEGTGLTRLLSRLFLAPGLDAVYDESTATVDVGVGTLRQSQGTDAVTPWLVHASVASSFGDRSPCRSVWWEIWEDLPQTFVTTFELFPPTESPESSSL